MSQLVITTLATRSRSELFATRVFSVVGAEDVIRAASLTGGALYHHFKDENELFAEVWDQLEQELIVGIDAGIAQSAALRRIPVGPLAYLLARRLPRPLSSSRTQQTQPRPAARCRPRWSP